MRTAVLLLSLAAFPASAEVTVTNAPSVATMAQVSSIDSRLAAVETATATAVQPATMSAAIIAATTGLASSSSVASAINSATTGLATSSALSAIAATVPTASNVAPPSVADAGATGTMTTVYALANHTHASKARKIIATSAADGTYTFNYSATPFTAAPICTAVAEVASGVTDVINVQIVGSPTTTSASFLVNRTQRSVVSLIGLTVLSVPSQPGATKIHIICIEP